MNFHTELQRNGYKIFVTSFKSHTLFAPAAEVSHSLQNAEENFDSLMSLNVVASSTMLNKFVELEQKKLNFLTKKR